MKEFKFFIRLRARNAIQNYRKKNYLICNILISVNKIY